MRGLALPFAAAALLASTAPADAQVVQGSVPVVCHNFAEIAKELGERYEEAPVSLGLQSNGNLVQVFASKRSGTWTLLSTTPAGFACVIAAGKGWESIPFDKEDPGA